MSSDRPFNGASPAPDYERITPLSRAGSSVTDELTTTAPQRRSIPAALVWSAGLLLAVAAIGVFYILPKNIEPNEVVISPPSDKAGSETQTAAQTTTPAATRNDTPDIAPWQIAQLQREREEAEEVLRDLVDKQFELEEHAVGEWAAEEFEGARADAERGDDFFGMRQYADASAAYRDGLEKLTALLEQMDDVLARAIRAGDQAILAGDAESASEQFELALAIQPENTQASHGLIRAGNLDEVLTLMDAGRNHEQAGELTKARDSYQQAAEIDPEWVEAPQSVARVNKTLTSRNYQQALSSGFAALAREDYGAARKAFESARRIRPDSSEAADGLAQAELSLRLQQIAGYRRQAQQFESEERWQEATEQYAAALELDPALVFATTGRIRAGSRAKLDEQLTKYLDDPQQLSDQPVYQSAIGAVNEARAIENPGPKLSEQIDELSKQIELAGRPVTVRLESDNLTNVVLYKVGQLGNFTIREIDLRPGTYTAVGTRNGYRDVRRQFTVVGGQTPPPVDIRCEEKI